MYQPPVTPPVNPKPPRKKRFLEAVCVSVDYNDFLSEFLIHNRLFFDKLVIVTSSKDLGAQNLCRVYDVECVITDSFYEDGAKFNKGKGINAGLTKLTKKEWVLHIDSDIILPPHFRTVFDNIYLDDLSIYGCDRMNCTGHDRWHKWLEKPRPQHEKYFLVHGNAFPLGARVAHYNQYDGWFPIGFFQLWNSTKSGIKKYPENGVGADHTDVVFSKKWHPRNRRFMAEIFVTHLDSESMGFGNNWLGRKSKPFLLGH